MVHGKNQPKVSALRHLPGTKRQTGSDSSGNANSPNGQREAHIPSYNTGIETGIEGMGDGHDYEPGLYNSDGEQQPPPAYTQAAATATQQPPSRAGSTEPPAEGDKGDAWQHYNQQQTQNTPTGYQEEPPPPSYDQTMENTQPNNLESTAHTENIRPPSRSPSPPPTEDPPPPYSSESESPDDER